MADSNMASPTSSGTVEFIVGDRHFETWYMIVGDIKASKKTPIVMLHGGPGMNHLYLKPHERLFIDGGIPVVFYIQIGCRKYPDMPAELWKRELFFDELDNLVERLGIKDSFDLYGHSWGGVFGSEYAATRKRPGLKRLILANTFASSELHTQCINDWIEKLPDGLPEIIKKHKMDGTTDSQEYLDAMTVYKNLHICTLKPWPEDLLASLQHSKGNRHPTAKLIPPDWSVVDILSNITCPTLVISSPTDEMAEPCVRPFFTNIPKCKWVDLQVASHVPMYEEPERYFDVLLQFLSSVEK